LMGCVKALNAGSRLPAVNALAKRTSVQFRSMASSSGHSDSDAEMKHGPGISWSFEPIINMSVLAAAGFGVYGFMWSMTKMFR